MTDQEDIIITCNTVLKRTTNYSYDQMLLKHQDSKYIVDLNLYYAIPLKYYMSILPEICDGLLIHTNNNMYLLTCN